MKKNIGLLLILFIIFGCSKDENEIDNTEKLISCEGDVILTSQEEINSFAQNNCQKIKGSLIIDDIGSENDGIADIFDLSPLSKLLEVTGTVAVVYSPNIQNVDGLKNLNKIGNSFAIEQNSNLLEINGFDNLETIGVAFSIYSNINLKKISGFRNLKRTADTGVNIFNANFDISFNPNLIEINGFDRIESATSLHIRENVNLAKLIGFNNLTETGEFTLASNPLNQINAFNKLEKINGDFTFWGTNLTTMENFSNLQTINGRFWIDYNHQLVNLNGLQNLTSILDELRIGYFEGNANLENIEGLIGLKSALRIHFQYNHSLKSLDGLNNLMENIYEIEIHSNESLNDFCAITDLVKKVTLNNGNISIFRNLFNPTTTDFNVGNCNR